MLVPGGLEQLDDDDTAARIYALGFEPRIARFRDVEAGELMVETFGDRLSPRDRELLSDERLAPLAHSEWLHEHVPGSRPFVRRGEGHFGFFEHAAEMFRALTTQPT